jgi:hypothetical protein
MPEAGDHLPTGSFTTANDVLTRDQVRRITRHKRERRKREDVPITTGRDEAVVSAAKLAERLLLTMPEVQERLARAAVYHEVLRTAQGRLANRCALERLARDFDGALGDASRIERHLADWPRVDERHDEGWSPTLTTRTGRPGTESTMSADSIRIACRSLALRPKARAELNAHRAAGYLGGGADRKQRGHQHDQAAHARGAQQADELAAIEHLAAHKPSVGEIEAEARVVEKCRRELRRVLAELGPDRT